MNWLIKRFKLTLHVFLGRPLIYGCTFLPSEDACIHIDSRNPADIWLADNVFIGYEEGTGVKIA